MKQAPRAKDKRAKAIAKTAKTIVKRMARQKAAFLRALKKTCGEVDTSAHRAGVGRTTVYVWRNDDPKFAIAWDEAITIGWGDFRAAGIERAMEGSDTLWQTWAKAKFPGEFNDKIELILNKNETFLKITNGITRIMNFVPKERHQEALEAFAAETGVVLRAPGILLPKPENGE